MSNAGERDEEEGLNPNDEEAPSGRALGHWRWAVLMFENIT